VNPVCGKTLVIVDDERSYVDLLAQLMTEHMNCPVVTFTRPTEALAALPQLDVGLVVTDYYMPQLNGLEFILRARQIWPTVPFIIITGHGVHFSPDDFAHVPELRTVLHKPSSGACWPKKLCATGAIPTAPAQGGRDRAVMHYRGGVGRLPRAEQMIRHPDPVESR